MTAEDARRRRWLLWLFLIESRARDQLNVLMIQCRPRGRRPFNTARFVVGFAKILNVAHAAAWAIGLTLNGKQMATTMTAPRPDAAARAGARAQVAQDAPFLESFVADIDAGKYVPAATATPANPPRPDAGQAQIAARADLYVKRVYNSIMKGWLEGLDDAANALDVESIQIAWITELKPCKDCKKLGLEGPYPFDALPTSPGNGQTVCLSNCRCRLEAVLKTNPKTRSANGGADVVRGRG
jgi:hypothetical protein